MKNFLWKLIPALISLQLFIYLLVNNWFFLRRFDPSYYTQLYSKSQYVLGPASKGGIGDDGLYTFAGYYYLFQKGDVSAVNFEHPPAGKYLIGLSIFLFQNENLINIIYYVLLLIITYRLGKTVVKNDLLSLAAAGFVSSNLLILDNLKRSLLDLPFTLFFTLAVYFFTKAMRKPKYYFLSMLFWGLTFSTRFFPSFILIYLFLLVIVFLYKRQNIKVFFFSSILVPLIYLLFHLSFFIYHPSFIEFLRHKKWMLNWFSGTVSITGNIWLNIFSGYYFDSSKKLVRNEYWNIFIPLITFFSLLFNKKYLLDKKNIEVKILSGIVIINLIYATFLTNGLEKFIMPVYPLLCILALSNISAWYSIITSWKKQKLKSLRIS